MRGQGGAWSLVCGLWAPGDPQFQRSLPVACGALSRVTVEFPSYSWEQIMESKSKINVEEKLNPEVDQEMYDQSTDGNDPEPSNDPSTELFTDHCDNHGSELANTDMENSAKAPPKPALSVQNTETESTANLEEISNSTKASQEAAAADVSSPAPAEEESAQCEELKSPTDDKQGIGIPHCVEGQTAPKIEVEEELKDCEVLPDLESVETSEQLTNGKGPNTKDVQDLDVMETEDKATDADVQSTNGKGLDTKDVQDLDVMETEGKATDGNVQSPNGKGLDTKDVQDLDVMETEDKATDGDVSQIPKDSVINLNDNCSQEFANSELGCDVDDLQETNAAESSVQSADGESPQLSSDGSHDSSKFVFDCRGASLTKSTSNPELSEQNVATESKMEPEKMLESSKDQHANEIDVCQASDVIDISDDDSEPPRDKKQAGSEAVERSNSPAVDKPEGLEVLHIEDEDFSGGSDDYGSSSGFSDIDASLLELDVRDSKQLDDKGKLSYPVPDDWMEEYQGEDGHFDDDSDFNYEILSSDDEDTSQHSVRVTSPSTADIGKESETVESGSAVAFPKDKQVKQDAKQGHADGDNGSPGIGQEHTMESGNTIQRVAFPPAQNTSERIEVPVVSTNVTAPSLGDDRTPSIDPQPGTSKSNSRGGFEPRIWTRHADCKHSLDEVMRRSEVLNTRTKQRNFVHRVYYKGEDPDRLLMSLLSVKGGPYKDELKRIAQVLPSRDFKRKFLKLVKEGKNPYTVINKFLRISDVQELILLRELRLFKNYGLLYEVLQPPVSPVLQGSEANPLTTHMAAKSDPRQAGQESAECDEPGSETSKPGAKSALVVAPSKESDPKTSKSNGLTLKGWFNHFIQIGMSVDDALTEVKKLLCQCGYLIDNTVQDYPTNMASDIAESGTNTVLSKGQKKQRGKLRNKCIYKQVSANVSASDRLKSGTKLMLSKTAIKRWGTISDYSRPKPTRYGARCTSKGNYKRVSSKVSTNKASGIAKKVSSKVSTNEASDIAKSGSEKMNKKRRKRRNRWFRRISENEEQMKAYNSALAEGLDHDNALNKVLARFYPEWSPPEVSSAPLIAQSASGSNVNNGGEAERNVSDIGESGGAERNVSGKKKKKKKKKKRSSSPYINNGSAQSGQSSFSPRNTSTWSGQRGDSTLPRRTAWPGQSSASLPSQTWENEPQPFSRSEPYPYNQSSHGGIPLLQNRQNFENQNSFSTPYSTFKRHSGMSTSEPGPSRRKRENAFEEHGVHKRSKLFEEPVYGEPAWEQSSNDTFHASMLPSYPEESTARWKRENVYGWEEGPKRIRLEEPSPIQQLHPHPAETGLQSEQYPASSIGIEEKFEEPRCRTQELPCAAEALQHEQGTASSRGSFHVCIVPKGYPRERLSEEQMDTLESGILEAILEIEDESVKPFFNGSSRNNGRYEIICQDQLSKTWLHKYVGWFQPWPNASLKIIPKKEESKIRANVFLPLCQNDDIDKIMKFLAKQNSGLNVGEWEVVQRHDGIGNTCLSVMVDEESAEVLKSRGGAVHFKMGFADVELVEDEAQDQESGISSSNKADTVFVSPGRADNVSSSSSFQRAFTRPSRLEASDRGEQPRPSGTAQGGYAAAPRSVRQAGDLASSKSSGSRTSSDRNPYTSSSCNIRESRGSGDRPTCGPGPSRQYARARSSSPDDVIIVSPKNDVIVLSSGGSDNEGGQGSTRQPIDRSRHGRSSSSTNEPRVGSSRSSSPRYMDEYGRGVVGRETSKREQLQRRESFQRGQSSSNVPFNEKREQNAERRRRSPSPGRSWASWAATCGDGRYRTSRTLSGGQAPLRYPTAAAENTQQSRTHQTGFSSQSKGQPPDQYHSWADPPHHVATFGRNVSRDRNPPGSSFSSHFEYQQRSPPPPPGGPRWN